jgi:sugar lactone lactonase YvrE
MTSNPIDGFVVDPSTIAYVGQSLERPECVLAERDGSLWTADSRGGVVHIRPDGSRRLIAHAPGGTALPNGLAFAPNGDILIANIGTDRLEAMTSDGDLQVLVDQIDGVPLGKVNFVLRDSKDRIWVTVSTRLGAWMDAVSPSVADGYIALYDGKALRIVADGFRFTNEIRFDAREEWLYVAETCGPCVTRLRVLDDGSLVDREVFGPSNHGAFIDGIAFDSYGNLWGHAYLQGSRVRHHARRGPQDSTR